MLFQLSNSTMHKHVSMTKRGDGGDGTCTSINSERGGGEFLTRVVRMSRAKEGKSFSTFSGGAFMMETRVGISLCCRASLEGPIESSRNKS